MQRHLIFYLIIYFVLINELLASTCLDENGKEVDYFIIYKIPKLEKSLNQQIRSGLGYAYTSSDVDQKDWIISSRSINDQQSLLGQTLSLLYKSNTVNYLLYNDQIPKTYNSSLHSSGAHAKGVLVLEDDYGFWLAHSVPRFLNLKQKNYQYPDSGKNNGQLLICISLLVKDTESIENIANHLLMIRPNIFDHNLSEHFLKQYPIYKDLGKKKVLKNKTQIGPIYSTKRVKFTIFGKAKKFNDDIYSHLIAPFVQDNLLVQTWRNGAGEKLESDCKDKYQIMNVDKIKLNDDFDWKYTEDHSKWAISSESNKSKDSLVCISDINRMKSQFGRGGGSICVHSTTLWKIFTKSVENVENCPKMTQNYIRAFNSSVDALSKQDFLILFLLCYFFLFVFHHCLNH